MTRLDDIFEDYIIINCLFFLIENKYLDNLYTDKGITHSEARKNYYLKHILEHMVYLDMVDYDEKTFRASKGLKELLDWRDINKLYIHLGYRQFFENIGNENAQKNHAYLAEGSSGIIKNETMDFLRSFFKDYPIKSILDLGSGKSKMIIELAEEYPEIQFYGFEINQEACDIASAEISEKELPNIRIIQGDIKNLHDLFQDIEVDCVMQSFVLHEFIEDGSLGGILNRISKYIAPKYILMREFCPPKKIHSIKHIVHDSFYFGHNLLHVLSKQQTYIVEEWNTEMEKHSYENIHTHHRFPYGKNESLYPIICYHAKNTK